MIGQLYCGSHGYFEHIVLESLVGALLISADLIELLHVHIMPMEQEATVLVTRASLLGARTLLVAPGITTSNKGISTSSSEFGCWAQEARRVALNMPGWL